MATQLKADVENKFNALCQRSADFDANVFRFPIPNNRIHAIGMSAPETKIAEIVRFADGVRPIASEKVKALMAEFLNVKRMYGSAAEKKLYENMSVPQFVTRLLTNRPMMFCGRGDSYALKKNIAAATKEDEQLRQGHGGFETIGTPSEEPPLVLHDLLSYDEIAISALIGVSVPTHFINNGDRFNSGRVDRDDDDSHQPSGVYVALVGARFERDLVMESRHMLFKKDVATEANGYGKHSTDPLMKMWAKFYELPGGYFPTFEEVLCADVRCPLAEKKKQNSARVAEHCVALNRHAFFNKTIYKRRMRLSIEPFLYEANARGREARLPAYCHIVGLGLGVWMVDPEQSDWMVEVYHEILSEIKFEHISDLDFSYFDAHSSMPMRDGQVVNEGRIKVHFSQRNPADKLRGEHQGKLLVAMYAWDGNSYPGNEYWKGSLCASGDPAAACCSAIAELQNPEINPKVSGEHIQFWPALK